MHARLLKFAILLLAAGPCGAVDLKQKVEFDIPAQTLSSALIQFSHQARVQVVISENLGSEKTSGVNGAWAIGEALTRLLAPAGLVYRVAGDTSITIGRGEGPRAGVGLDEGREVQVAQGGSEAARKESVEDEIVVSEAGIPEILVKGSKILNMDIPRSRDDVLPFVVFDRKRIEQSGAVNLEDFFRRRLTMNTQQGSNSQNVSSAGVQGNRSQVNLRGLGTAQTLILIDGRRTSNSTNFQGNMLQQDLNGIPLSAVERIEVLPTSASGIYGGEATGGVINIVMRRDYQGLEVRLNYDNTFDTDAAKRKIDLTSGFNLQGGKTNVLLAASWSDGNVLSMRDRDFLLQYRNQAFANRPALVMPPDASAPPFGYTTNICSSSNGSSCNGPALVLKSGQALGSSFTSVPVGYAATDNGAALVTRAGQYNLDWSNSGSFFGVSTAVGAGALALLNNPTVESLGATLRREFSPSVQAFIEVSASNNVGHFASDGIFSNPTFTLPVTALNNPFQQQIRVTVPLVQPPQNAADYVVHSSDRRVVGGVIVRLPKQWQAELDYIWSRTGETSRRRASRTTAGGANAAIDAALRSDVNFNPLRDTNVYLLDWSPYFTENISGPYHTTTKDATLAMGGQIGGLPGGRPTLSMRLEHRDELFEGGIFASNFSGFTFIVPGRSQSVDSVYAEVSLPLVSAKNRLPWMNELEVQLSGRWDGYTVKGATNSLTNPTPTTPVVRAENELQSTNPAVGLRFKPVEDVMLRASYGTGFVPPSVSQIAPNPNFGNLLLTSGAGGGNLLDPRRGNEVVLCSGCVRGGGNPDLEPEESKSRSGGIVLTPRWVSGLRLSIDYTRIKRINRIGNHPQAAQGLLNDEAVFPGRITRNPDPASFGAFGVGPVTFMDNTFLNIALADTEAVDAQLDYSLETGRWGTFEFYALGTWERHNYTQTREGQPVVDDVGFTNGVLEYRANAALTWTLRDWTLGWNAQYYDDYRVYAATSVASRIADDTQTQGSHFVSNQITHDVFSTYRFGGGSHAWIRLLDRTELTIGIRNVFNSKPPRFLSLYSSYGDPRLASYYITARRQF